jgi:DNA primase
MSLLVYSLLEEILGDPKHANHDSGQVSFDCPACAEDKGLVNGDGKGNLEVNYKKGVFKCWVCYINNNMHGTIQHLVRRYGDDGQIMRYKLFDVDYEYGYEKDVEDIKLITELPKEFKPFKDGSIYNSEYRDAFNYINGKRKIPKEIIEKFNIGYATEGKYANRIIVPSYNKNNKVNFFTGRHYGYSKLKYLHPDGDSSEIIFNEYFIDWNATIYLVEGVFDHLMIPNSIPMLGKTLSDKLFESLYYKSMANIVVLLDSDAAYDIKKIYRRLNTGRLRGKIRAIFLPRPFDIGEIYEKQRIPGLIKALKTNIIIPQNDL